MKMRKEKLFYTIAGHNTYINGNVLNKTSSKFSLNAALEGFK
ncbi:MAG TPA: hypothetical protein VJK05_00185 [archaeon]|nr:hypothetical protein [archaeon]